MAIAIAISHRCFYNPPPAGDMIVEKAIAKSNFNPIRGGNIRLLDA